MAAIRPEEAGLPLPSASYGYLQRLLASRTGTVLECGKEYVVEARLFGVARDEGFSSVGGLLDALQTEPDSGELHRTVVEAMLNGETSFFRDHYPFEVMREQVFPELLASRRASRVLNIWCAAVASGQEAYSVAMLLRTHFPETAGWNVKIWATDVSEATLTRARAGRFRQVEVNRGLPAALLVRHFKRVGVEWQIEDSIRKMVDFSQANLAGTWPSFPPIDLLLLRNVLLYFSSDVRRTIMQKVRKSLRQDGYLFVGGSETSLVLDRTFEAVRAGKTVYYRLGTDPARPGGRSGATTGETRP